MSRRPRLAVIAFPTRTRQAVAGAQVNVWEYVVPTNVELLFVPGDPTLYISGRLRDAAGNPVRDLTCSVSVWDNFGRLRRGTVWTGTTSDVNDAPAMRGSGHPLVYNSGPDVLAIGGDLVRLDIETPAGGPIVDPDNTALSVVAYRQYRR